MPLNTLRGLTSPTRTIRANRQLGAVLAFVAGAVNAGGFLAVNRYTSHMTGVVSAIADDSVLGNVLSALGGLGLLVAFIAGAMTTAVTINWARHRELASEFALTLLLEAGLLLIFGTLGANLALQQALLVPVTVLLLCFIMGLQNAIITKISKAEIRTTHMTGIITDLGIELGRMLYWNRTYSEGQRRVTANRDKLRVHALILGMFFTGALTGAFAFAHYGFRAAVPLAALLALMAALPVFDDLRAHLKNQGGS